MKILLVDDSKSARYALRTALLRHGEEVETADSAEAAFLMLKGDLPDAILMDHLMPGLNGLEALDVIRADSRTASIPVVMCTSHDEAEFAAEAQRRGAVGVLPKLTATEKLPEILSVLQRGLAARPEPALPTPTPTPPVAEPQRPLTLEPELVRLIENRIDTCLTALIEPLLQDLEHNLTERLLATTRQLIQAQEAQAESQAASRAASHATQTRELIEARLAEERQAAKRLQTEAITAEVQAAAGRLIGGTLPDLLNAGLETERNQIMAMVNQCLRDFSAQDATAAGQDEDRLAAFDGIMTAKTREVAEVAKREATEAAAGAVARAQRIAEELMQEVRGRLTWVYVAILGAALVGGLAGVAGFFPVPLKVPSSPAAALRRGFR